MLPRAAPPYDDGCGRGRDRGHGSSELGGSHSGSDNGSGRRLILVSAIVGLVVVVATAVVIMGGHHGGSDYGGY